MQSSCFTTRAMPTCPPGLNLTMLGIVLLSLPLFIRSRDVGDCELLARSVSAACHIQYVLIICFSLALHVLNDHKCHPTRNHLAQL